MLRFQHFIDKNLTDGGEVVSLMRSTCSFPPTPCKGRFLLPICVRGRINPRAIVLQEGLEKLEKKKKKKKEMTLSEMEATTFRLIA
jgi:hypothetical protein